MQRRCGTNAGVPSATNSLPVQQDNIELHKKNDILRRKKRRKAVLSAFAQFRYELARNIEEDGPFMLFVGTMGCILLIMIVIVGYKLAQVLFEDGNSSRRGHRYPGNHGSRQDKPEEFEPMPFNPIYRVPEASELVGDRSSEYAELRKEYDEVRLPLDVDRSLNFVSSILDQSPTPRTMDFHHSDQVVEPYDIYNCPFDPPAHYPYEWNLVQILKDWPADDVRVPDHIYQGLCVFDYQKDYDKALNYRNKEQPFVVENDPSVARTVERWHQPGYMENMLAGIKHRTEYNTNNHFLFQMPPGGASGMRGLSKATQDKLNNLEDNHGRKAHLQNEEMIPKSIRMSYKTWLQHANASKAVSSNEEHWYYRLIGCGYMAPDGSCDAGSTEALFDELPYFQPKANLYVGDPDEQKGIHCRFGMQGVIAENHFDGSRNSIALLRGKRRYILAHPENCDKLTLLPMKHPSARHSAIDYTKPDLETYPEFAQATSNEVVLQAGQVLYLPTNWFHFIVSLDLNMQCNTRSGITDHYMTPIHKCGFI